MRVSVQALLEAKGGCIIALTAIFAGVVPIMAGTVLGTISNRMIPLGAWIAGISPLSMPFYACGTLLSLAELPANAARAVPRAFYFWLFVAVLVTIWLIHPLARIPPRDGCECSCGYGGLSGGCDARVADQRLLCVELVELFQRRGRRCHRALRA